VAGLFAVALQKAYICTTRKNVSRDATDDLDVVFGLESSLIAVSTSSSWCNGYSTSKFRDTEILKCAGSEGLACSTLLHNHVIHIFLRLYDSTRYTFNGNLLSYQYMYSTRSGFL
jgi:hypothetical protein